MPPLLSPFLERRRHQAVAPYLQGDVLDLGCGYATIQLRLGPRQAYVGIEQSPEVAEYLRGQYPAREFQVCDLEGQDLAPGRAFDTVLMMAVIEHLENPDNLLRQLALCLKPGGRLVITTPTPLGHRLHNLGAHLGLFHLGAAQDHKQVYSPRRLRDCLEAHGLEVIVQGTFLLGGNQLVVCALPNGI